MDSFVIPVLFLLSIGMAIVYNLGSNYFFGEISYITKALAAVLQLGVTMDYSIFLMHSYQEQQVRYNGDKERAMAHAISQTFSSVIGSFRIMLYELYFGKRYWYCNGKRRCTWSACMCNDSSIYDPVL